MPIAEPGIRCPHEGCDVLVAWGKRDTDDYQVWEIGLHDSVASAKKLHIGMGNGHFIKARDSIVHTVVNGKVVHTID